MKSTKQSKTCCFSEDILKASEWKQKFVLRWSQRGEDDLFPTQQTAEVYSLHLITMNYSVFIFLKAAVCKKSRFFYSHYQLVTKLERRVHLKETRTQISRTGDVIDHRQTDGSSHLLTFDPVTVTERLPGAVTHLQTEDTKTGVIIWVFHSSDPEKIWTQRSLFWQKSWWGPVQTGGSTRSAMLSVFLRRRLFPSVTRALWVEAPWCAVQVLLSPDWTQSRVQAAVKWSSMFLHEVFIRGHFSVRWNPNTFMYPAGATVLFLCDNLHQQTVTQTGWWRSDVVLSSFLSMPRHVLQQSIMGNVLHLPYWGLRCSQRERPAASAHLNIRSDYFHLSLSITQHVWH